MNFAAQREIIYRAKGGGLRFLLSHFILIMDSFFLQRYGTGKFVIIHN